MRYAGWPYSATLSPEKEALRPSPTWETYRFARYPHTPLLGRIWELRDNLTVYDAAYVALAEALEAPLVTMDGRLSQAPGIRAASRGLRVDEGAPRKEPLALYFSNLRAVATRGLRPVL